MKIALLGDTALFGKNSLDNNKNVFDYYKDIKEQLCQYDYVVANLETPFAVEKKSFGYKSAYISSGIQNMNLLKYIGITTISLANNHLFDYGIKSYELTKKILTENSIQYFGVEQKQVFIEKDENKIALSGFCCYSSNPLGVSLNGVNELNYPIIEQTLIKNNKAGYNNILSIHAGTEHINFPSYDHIMLARKLSKIAPYIFYGHHPHVLQGIEEYNNSIIAYSLGNFCFDDVYSKKSKEPLVKQTDNNKSSIILELEFHKNKLLNYKLIPIYAGDTRMEIGNKQISKNLDSYSMKLNLDKVDYIKFRSELLNSLIQDRNARRDLMWYLKRMNLRSFFIIRDLYLNRKRYNERLKRYL